MKRTIIPEFRKSFPKENIILEIKEEEQALMVGVTLINLDKQGFPEYAQIILEAYTRTNIERMPLGVIGKYNSEEHFHPLPFEASERAQIKFRLKIYNPENFKLLGYAEQIKEKKFTSSLLNIDTSDEDVKNIYQIKDFDSDNIVLHLNPNLGHCLEQLKPILAEMAFKDILYNLLAQAYPEDIYESKWFKLANGLCEYTEDSEKDRVEWINQVLCKFAENKKLIDSITKTLQ